MVFAHLLSVGCLDCVPGRGLRDAEHFMPREDGRGDRRARPLSLLLFRSLASRLSPGVLLVGKQLRECDSCFARGHIVDIDVLLNSAPPITKPQPFSVGVFSCLIAPVPACCWGFLRKPADCACRPNWPFRATFHSLPAIPRSDLAPWNWPEVRKGRNAGPY